MAFSAKVLVAIVAVASFVSANSCAQNNCYRQFNGAAYTASAQSYCSKFKAASNFTIPSYATEMCTSAAMIASVCSCAYPPTSTTISTSTTTSSAGTCSVTAFITVTTTFTVTSTLPASCSLTSSIPSSPITSATTTTLSSLNGAPVVNQCHTNGDNCQRAMIGEGGVGATAFCSSWTSAIITNTALLPTYATQCTSNAISQISSACTCLGFGDSSGSASSTRTASV